MNERVKALVGAIRRLYPKYNAQFYYPSEVGEYYGRGQLEGLAAGLWSVYLSMDAEDKASVMAALSVDERAYLDVWGEEHCGLPQDLAECGVEESE